MNKKSLDTTIYEIQPIKKTKTNKKVMVPAKMIADKTPKWVEDYVDCFSFKQKPMSDAGLERFAQDLMAWAYGDENALRIGDFARSKGVPRHTYYQWVNKYPVIKAAHEEAMASLGSRREIGAITRKYSEKAVYHTLYQYDEDAEKAARFHASLKSESDDAANQRRYIIVEEKVVIPSFGSSSLVPEKD